ncbi:MAG TPA: hypothetical protein VK636_18765, partial [Gemmatimonadaceae bacterium]|nr:hypothetical protein [Gemmatimonadaceae bacterium]
MPDRSSSARTAIRGVTLGVDVVLFTPRGNELAVLLTPLVGGRGRGKERWSLPTDSLSADESLGDAAARVARDVLGAAPSFLDQAGAHGGARKPSDAAAPQISVTYFGLVPVAGGNARRGAEWLGMSELPVLSVRERDQLDATVAAMRARVDQQPIAFRLLPPAF